MNDHSNVYSSEYPKQILNNIKHTKNGISTFAIEALFGYQDPLPENPMSLSGRRIWRLWQENRNLLLIWHSATGISSIFVHFTRYIR